ncbi:MAG TPA: diguanylate cyclase [Acidimicrobiales bacterium]|nr:diguanylate cyclase [Acidimicrobiales bacterium]
MGEPTVELDPQIWEAFFEPGPAPMAVYDRDSLGFLAVNATGRSLYGYSPEAMSTMSVVDLYPPEDVTDRRRIESDLGPAERKATRIARHRLADGRLADMQVKELAVLWSGRPAWMVTVTDVSHLRQVERELAAEADRLHRVVRLQAELAEAGPDVDRSLRLVVTGVAQLAQAANCSVWWADGDHLKVRATAGNPPTYAVGDAVPIASSLAGSCFASEEEVYVADTATYSDYTRALAERTGIGTLVMVPLSAGGSVVGVLGVSAPTPGALAGSGRDALRLVAGLVAGAVQRAEAAAANLAALEALQASENRFSQAFDTSPIGMAFSDRASRLLQVNPALCRLVGRAGDDLLGLPLAGLAHPEDDSHLARSLVELADGRRSTYQGDHCLAGADGAALHVLLSSTTMGTGPGGSDRFFTQIVDVSEQYAINGRLTHAATHDALTGLSNRIHFADRLEHAVTVAAREKRRVGLLYIDLDRFKEVNDGFGHHCGDEVLIELSRRLGAVVRDTDTVARLGGDEFAVLLSNPSSIEESLVVAQRAIDSLGRPLRVGPRRLAFKASIGVAHWPEHGPGPDELLRHADGAMYLAKAAGGNRFEVCGATR